MMAENNGNGKLVRLEVNQEWLERALDGLRDDVKEVDRKVNSLLLKVAGIGALSGLLTSLVVVLIGAHIL